MSHTPDHPRHRRRFGVDSDSYCKAGPTSHAMRPVSASAETEASQASSVPRYLTNIEAAAFLRLSPRTLEKQRSIGGGPRFHKFGRRVMYALVDLEAWVAERSFETTFDPEYLNQHPGAQRDDE